MDIPTSLRISLNEVAELCQILADTQPKIPVSIRIFCSRFDGRHAAMNLSNLSFSLRSSAGMNSIFVRSKT
jgi:hypothetical protein